MLVVGLPLGFLVRERVGTLPSREHAKNAPPSTGASVSEGLRSRVFWVIVAVLFCSSFSQNGVITQLSAMLTDRGVPASGAALAVSAMGVTALVGKWLTGWLLDRFIAPRVAMTLLLLAALGAFILSFAHTMFMAVAGASLIGFGMGGESDVTPWLIARYFGLRSFSTLLMR